MENSENTASLSDLLPKNRKGWFTLIGALLPFIIVTLYMSFKPPPPRLERTHGGTQNVPLAQDVPFPWESPDTKLSPLPTTKKPPRE